MTLHDELRAEVALLQRAVDLSPKIEEDDEHTDAHYQQGRGDKAAEVLISLSASLARHPEPAVTLEHVGYVLESARTCLAVGSTSPAKRFLDAAISMLPSDASEPVSANSRYLQLARTNLSTALNEARKADTNTELWLLGEGVGAGHAMHLREPALTAIGAIEAALLAVEEVFAGKLVEVTVLTAPSLPDVDAIAHEVWAHASASLCGSPTCIYSDGDRDADYENNCPHCKVAASEIATAIVAMLTEAGA